MQRFGQFLPRAQRIRLGWPRKQGTEFRKAPSYTALYNLLTQLDLHARGRAAFRLVSDSPESYSRCVVESILNRDMIELIQFPWSPFCLVQRRILDFSGQPFKTINLPSSTDRSLVWKLTKERYYGVPIIKDGRTVVFEVDEESQVIGKYLDDKLGLGLFPRELEGVQAILWRYIESEIEGCTFRLNDVHWRQIVPKADQLGFLRHKERKFGRGCLDQWRQDRKQWQRRLAAKLIPFEEMLMHHSFLLEARPRFVDFDLCGMLANYLYSGHYHLPARHTRLQDWYARMQRIKASQFAS